ncbi:MAG: hypothetical protein AABY15_01945 [Nanoarchaeota archaeon]
MEEQKEVRDNEDNKVLVFGFMKNRFEIFLNGVIFLALQIAHETMVIVQQLPDKWSEKDLMEVERPFWITIIFFATSYLLINYSIFGGEGRMEKMQKKYGTFGILARKFFMMTSIIFVSSLLPIFIIQTFF